MQKREKNKDRLEQSRIRVAPLTEKKRERTRDMVRRISRIIESAEHGARYMSTVIHLSRGAFSGGKIYTITLRERP